MKSLAIIFVSLLTVYSINCEVYFEEKFPDGKCKILFYGKCRTLVSRRLAACAIVSIGSYVGSRFILGVFLCKTGQFVIADSWESKWVYSEHPGKEFGKFKLTAGKFYSNTDEDKGTFLIGKFLCPKVLPMITETLVMPTPLRRFLVLCTSGTYKYT